MNKNRTCHKITSPKKPQKTKGLYLGVPERDKKTPVLVGSVVVQITGTHPVKYNRQCYKWTKAGRNRINDSVKILDTTIKER